jgi:hypothetical protein
MPVMDVAAAFYTSGTFWAGAGVLAAVLGTVAVVWVTFTVGFPRRRLYYGMRAAAPLLTAPPGMRSDLELRHRGTPADRKGGDHADAGDGAWQVLADPRVLTLELVSRGRKDIPSDAYDDHQPLRLDVGARIVEVLQAISRPAAQPAPQITADGTSLRIGPSLIGKRHEITITVLTDGGEPSLTCQSPLIDVQIRQRNQERDAVLAWQAAVVVVVVAAARPQQTQALIVCGTRAWPGPRSSAPAGTQKSGNRSWKRSFPSRFRRALCPGRPGKRT